MKRSWFFFLTTLFSSLFYASTGWSQSLDLIYQNNSAVRQFAAEKKMQAYEEFLATLLVAPEDPVVQFNVGSSLQALGDVEKSEKLYKQLLLSIDQQLKLNLPKEQVQEWLKVKFAVLYNLGVHYQTKSEIDLALDSYQKALELLPDSKEVKTNIELMFNGNGGGKGKGDPKKGDKDQQEGDGSSEDKNEGEQDKGDQPRTNKPQDKGEGDGKQLSNEDLKRIMEELKQQEQSIRSKVQRKGEKSEPKDKQW